MIAMVRRGGMYFPCIQQYAVVGRALIECASTGRNFFWVFRFVTSFSFSRFLSSQRETSYGALSLWRTGFKSEYANNSIPVITVNTSTQVVLLTITHIDISSPHTFSNLPLLCRINHQQVNVLRSRSLFLSDDVVTGVVVVVWNFPCVLRIPIHGRSNLFQIFVAGGGLFIHMLRKRNDARNGRHHCLRKMETRTHSHSQLVLARTLIFHDSKARRDDRPHSIGIRMWLRVWQEKAKNSGDTYLCTTSKTNLNSICRSAADTIRLLLEKASWRHEREQMSLLLLLLLLQLLTLFQALRRKRQKTNAERLHLPRNLWDCDHLAAAVAMAQSFDSMLETFLGADLPNPLQWKIL